jgi:methyl-accepting chemotaxis protein
MEKKTKAYKRKQFLVAKRFQFKYIGLLLVLMFVTALLCSYVVYYTMMISMGEKLANVYPQGRLVSIINAVNLRIMAGLIIIAPLVAVFGLLASHRIAGPMYRMEQYLKGVAAGDLSVRLTLRQGDEFVPIAEGINKALNTIKESLKAQKDRLDKGLSSFETLKRELESRSFDHNKVMAELNQVKEDLSAVNKELARYKV